MAERAVHTTGKNEDGDITSLCNESAEWSPVSKLDAIEHIESGTHAYYVPWSVGSTRIRVVVDESVEDGKYLRTDRDDTQKNNLDDLDDC